MAWWGWAILAAGIGLSELHVPGGYLIWIALGAALTATTRAVYELSVTTQIATFIVASALSCFAGYFVYRHVDYGQPNGPLNQRGMLTVGAHGVVCSNIQNGEGKVRLGDTVWLAEGPNLPEGTSVVVKSVRGARVVVDLVEQPQPH